MYSSSHCLALKPALVPGHLCGPWHNRVTDTMPDEVSHQHTARRFGHVLLRRAGRIPWLRGTSACLQRCQAASQDAGGSIQQLLEMQVSRQILAAGCPRDACILLAALLVHQPQMYRLPWQVVHLTATVCFLCKAKTFWLDHTVHPAGPPTHARHHVNTCSVLLGDIIDNFW